MTAVCNVAADALAFRCLGCCGMHIIGVGPGSPGARWAWNRSLERPIISPSIFVKTVRLSDANRAAYDALRGEPAIRGAIEDPRFRWWCHSFIGSHVAPGQPGHIPPGHIQYLPDCSHALAGKTVPLPPWEQQP